MITETTMGCVLDAALKADQEREEAKKNANREFRYLPADFAREALERIAALEALCETR